MNIQSAPLRGDISGDPVAAVSSAWDTSPVRDVLSLVSRPGRYRILEARDAPELSAATADVLLCTPGDARAPQLSPGGRRLRAACVLAGIAHDVVIMPGADLLHGLAAANIAWVAARSGRPLASFGTWLVSLDNLSDLPALMQLCIAAGIAAEVAARRTEHPRIIVTGAAAAWHAVVAGVANHCALGDPEAWDMPAVLRGELTRGDVAVLHGTLPFAPREWPLPLVDAADDAVLLELARGCALGLTTCGIAGGHVCPPRHADVARAGARAAGAIAESGTDRLALHAGPIGSATAWESTLLDIERQLLGRGVSLTVEALDPRDAAAQSWATLSRMGCRAVRLAPVLALGDVTRVAPGASVTPVVSAGSVASRTGISEIASGTTTPDVVSPLTLAVHAPLVLHAVEAAIAAGIRHIIIPVVIGFPAAVAVSAEAWAVWVREMAVVARQAPQAVKVTLEILAAAPEPLAPWPLSAWPSAAALCTILEEANASATHKSLRVHVVAVSRAAAETQLRRADVNVSTMLAPVVAARLARPAFPLAGTREERDTSWDTFPLLAPGTCEAMALRMVPRTPPWSDPVPPGATLAATSAQHYGRRKRRETVTDGTVLKWRVQFTKDDEARFAAHLDIGRVFDRALRRAQIPVAYSKGNTPRPKISYGPPLPLGMTSQAEYLDLELREPFRGDLLFTLSRCLPQGIDVVAAVAIPGTCDSLTASIDVAAYSISARALPAIVTPMFRAAAESFYAAAHFSLARKPGDAPVNVRPSVLDFVLDETGLTLVVRLSHAAAVRPDVLVAALLAEAGPGDPRLIPVQRTALLIALPNRRITPLEAVRATSALGYGKLAEEGWGPLHAS